MLRRTHVEPFLVERDGRLHVELLEDRDGRVVAFLHRLLRLLRRLEGRDRRTVLEALRRQERRVRDVRRLDGIAKTVLDACRFAAPAGAERAPEVRDVLFAVRGERWPPTPGDAMEPYRMAAERLGLPAEEVQRLLYADHPDRLVLRRVPASDSMTSWCATTGTWPRASCSRPSASPSPHGAAGGRSCGP